MLTTYHQHKNASPTSFEWIFGSDPVSGFRKWIRNGTEWREVYPTGRVEIFKNISHTSIKGITGNIIQKKDGYLIFIPDLNPNNLQRLGAYPNHKWRIMFKYGGHGPWRTPGTPMKNIQPTLAELQGRSESESRLVVRESQPHETTYPLVERMSDTERMANKVSMITEKILLPIFDVAMKKMEFDAKQNTRKMKERKSIRSEMDEEIKIYLSHLEHFDLTQYKNYEDFKHKVKEVNMLNISDGFKENLFNKLKTQQEKQETKPHFFDSDKNTWRIKEMEKFLELLEILHINTKEEWDEFKKSENYTEIELSDYTKTRLLHRHLKRNELVEMTDNLSLNGDSADDRRESFPTI